jgi:hypothetical protein
MHETARALVIFLGCTAPALTFTLVWAPGHPQSPCGGLWTYRQPEAHSGGDRVRQLTKEPCP